MLQNIVYLFYSLLHFALKSLQSLTKFNVKNIAVLVEALSQTSLFLAQECNHLAFKKKQFCFINGEIT